MHRFLSKITPEVGLIFLKDEELTPEINELISYLADGIELRTVIESPNFPKYLFTKQFNDQILITISKSGELDEFSSNFKEAKKVLKYEDLIKE